MIRTIKSTKDNNKDEKTTYKVIKGNSYRLENIFDYKYFSENDTIILQSSTGTGKTFTCSKWTFQYMKENPNCRILSICAKRSLCTEHYKYIQKMKNPVYYQDVNAATKFEHINSVVCINSLYKYSYSNEFIKNNLILYIDEISIFLLSELCENTTIDRNLKQIYLMIMNLVNNAKKVIVSQNQIDDVVYFFLSKRKSDKKLMVKNSYVNNENKKAYNVVDKEMFGEILSNDIKNGGFLCACDSKEITERLMKRFLKTNPQLKEVTHIITSDTSKNFNVERDIKSKNYYFYSPSIIYGSDFNFKNPTNQYIYITTKSVNANSLFQMSMRTRNIASMYYFYEKNVKKREAQYSDLADCKQDIMQKMQSYSKLLSLSSYIDPTNEEMVIVENSYFEIFIRSQYENDKLRSDPIHYFEKHLKNNGFSLEKVDEVVKSEELKNLQKERKDEINERKRQHEEDFDEMMDQCKDINDIEACGSNFIFEQISKKMKFINIGSLENIQKYKEIILDDEKYKNCMKSLYLFKTDSILEKNFKIALSKSFKCKMMREHLFQISSIRKLLKKYDICLTELNDGNKEPIEIDNSDKKILKDMRFSRKIYPKTKYDLINFLYVKINKLCNEKIIKSVNKNKKKNGAIFTLRKDRVKYLIGMVKEHNLYAYEDEFVDITGRKKPPKQEDDAINANMFL